MKKHSSGLWKKQSIGNTARMTGFDIYVDKWPTGIIFKMEHDKNHHTDDTTITANANLVTASPKMLDVLERIDKTVGNYNPKFPMGQGMYANFKILMEEARKIITEAKEGHEKV